MKAKFTTFGGGLLTGLLLVLLLSSASRENSSAPATASAAEDVSGFTLVPLDEFYQDVARYNTTHAMKIKPGIPRYPKRNGEKQGKEKLPSRMFIYSVPTLERFFTVIKAAAMDAQLDPQLVAIRFYYGVYPMDKQIAGRNYGSLHTIFMVPNYWSEEEGKYKDIELLQLASQIKKYQNNLSDSLKLTIIRKNYLKNLFKTQRTTGIFMLDASAVPFDESLPLKSGSLFPMPPPVINQGQLCPPNCPEESLLDAIDAAYPTKGYRD